MIYQIKFTDIALQDLKTLKGLSLQHTRKHLN